MDFHPAANLFPLMPPDELSELAADIREHGLHHPIVLHEELILDGRNRFLACKEAGVEPAFEDWSGEGSAVQWVLSENLQRRHLTAGQRAAVALAVKAALEDEMKERQLKGLKKGSAPVSADSHSRDSERKDGAAVAAELLGTSRRSVYEAQRLEKHAPELFEEVRAGDKTLYGALQDAQEQGLLPEPEPRKKAAAPRAPSPRQYPSRATAPEVETPVGRLLFRFQAGLARDLAHRYPQLSRKRWDVVVDELQARIEKALRGYEITPEGEHPSSSPSPEGDS